MIAFVKKLDDGYYMISKERVSEDFVICSDYEFEVAQGTRGCWYTENNKLVFTKDTETRYTANQSVKYKQEVIQAIHKRYSIDDEVQLLNEKDSRVSEYNEYRTFVNDCKQQIREQFKMSYERFKNEISMK